MWGALVLAASRTEGVTRWMARVLLAALAALALGSQAYTAARYGTYFNWRVALQGTTLLPAFAPQLASQRALLFATILLPVAVVLLAVVLRARLAPAGPRAAAVGLVLGAAAIATAVTVARPSAGWDNGAPPDVLYLDAVGGLIASKRAGQDIMTALPYVPASRAPIAVPKLEARPAAPRDVLFVVTESVRASDVCSAYDPACETTPFTNALLPKRFGFRQVRAVDSTTAISVAVMLTGLPPTARRDALHSAPLIYEYAHAAGIECSYWTSQNLLFGNAGRYLDGAPISRWVTGTELEPYATYQCGAHDGRVLVRAVEDLAKARSPYLAVLQLANTHYPYWMDEEVAPFTARGRTVRKPNEDQRADISDRYKDAVRRQDKLLAGALQAIRATPAGAKAIIVFVSDHGEQLHEREQLGHTWSLYDEEIRVPLWIDAPPGTLTDEEASRLRALESAPLTTLDVAPTVLDLLGIWDAPQSHRCARRCRARLAPRRLAFRIARSCSRTAPSWRRARRATGASCAAR